MSIVLLHFTLLLYTQTYNANVSPSIYLQKLTVLQFMNVKSLAIWLEYMYATA